MSIKNRKLQVFVSSTFTDLREETTGSIVAIEILNASKEMSQPTKFESEIV